MYRTCLIPVFILLILPWEAAAVEIVSSSYVGQPGDSAVAVAIQPAGVIVLAANVSGGAFTNGEAGGVLATLSPDGARLLKTLRVGDHVYDMATDEQGNVYAATAEAVVKLDRQLKSVIWKKIPGQVCKRIDVARDGHCTVLCHTDPDDEATDAGRILVFDPDGRQLGEFKGQHFTQDVCLDSASKTVIYTGFRNARSWEGKRVFPVQIAYVIGRSYTGEEKYRLYDWGTDREASNFLNKPTNNMADTRGYRCAIGKDGKLYCAFECAGGNHIFRWEPRLTDDQWVSTGAKKPKGDHYHAFHNSRAEHKTFIACYDPATGEFLRGQEFCGRLSSGRANAVRVKKGAISATSDGSLLLTGTSASGLPATLLPPGTGDYAGGAFLLMMKHDLTQRQACVRFLPSADATAVASRRLNDGQIVVVCGTILEKAGDPFYTKNAIQSDGKAGCGFLTVLAVGAD